MYILSPRWKENRARARARLHLYRLRPFAAPYLDNCLDDFARSGVIVLEETERGVATFQGRVACARRRKGCTVLNFKKLIGDLAIYGRFARSEIFARRNVSRRARYIFAAYRNFFDESRRRDRGEGGGNRGDIQGLQDMTHTCRR